VVFFLVFCVVSFPVRHPSLSGVSCSTAPPPPVLAADVFQADRAAPKLVEDVADDVYDQQVADFTPALSAYREAQFAYSQWCDEDAHAAAVLTDSVLPQYAAEFMGLDTVSEM
jgi:hypothetical protein